MNDDGQPISEQDTVGRAFSFSQKNCFTLLDVHFEVKRLKNGQNTEGVRTPKQLKSHPKR